MKTDFDYSEEMGFTICRLEDKEGGIFVGTAECHPKDKDMQSRLYGEIISEWRAWIDYYRCLRDNNLRPQLKALKQLYYSINQSKRFNPKSYENIMLQRQIRLTENDLATVKNEIAMLKKNIKDYILKKDLDHAKIRTYKSKPKTLVEDNQ